ncbi:MAG: trypsin-like peptidase domain-containing protein, partial [Clostridiales bacterium]|nr:trypsin-like peptidase domain-containing protein [Clostridiales bacterium]
AYNVGVLIYQNDSLYTEGSGVIAQEDETGTYTYIITCAHVINYSSVDVSVLMADGTEYAAEVVGFDTRTDIGVVRIEASGLTCAEFANSDELIVGQTVYAVGNPGGSEFFGSITNGIISAIDRPITSSTNYEMECIQHTAAINPGNSGGALVNGEGKVIGINSMKIASTEYEGMGFAVPSNVVVSVFNSIIENGYVAGRAKLGISYASPSNYSQTYSMYVQMKGLPSGTIVIAEIDSESAFTDTDVQVGDMITAVNGTDMTDTGMLADMIEDMSVGDTITLTIVRVDTTTWTQTEFDVTVTLVEDKSGTSVEEETTTNSSSMEDWYEYFRQYYGY